MGKPIGLQKVYTTDFARDHLSFVVRRRLSQYVKRFLPKHIFISSIPENYNFAAFFNHISYSDHIFPQLVYDLCCANRNLYGFVSNKISLLSCGKA